MFTFGKELVRTADPWGCQLILSSPYLSKDTDSSWRHLIWICIKLACCLTGQDNRRRSVVCRCAVRRWDLIRPSYYCTKLLCELSFVFRVWLARRGRSPAGRFAVPCGAGAAGPAVLVVVWWPHQSQASISNFDLLNSPRTFIVKSGSVVGEQLGLIVAFVRTLKKQGCMVFK
jgi:hypothetical protein